MDKMDVRQVKSKIALSWSGGKDSCFALHELTNQGFEVSCLVTTAPKETGVTFAHGERIELIEAQGRSLGIPVHIIHCTFDTYTDDFRKELTQLKNRYQLKGIAFGDLYLDGHREWGEALAKDTGLEALYPLWMQQKDTLLELSKFIDSGYRAIVIRVMREKLSDEWLGKQLDGQFLEDIQKYDICPMGESGEYHTFVYDGPLFHEEIKIRVGNKLKEDLSNRLEVFLIE